MEILIGISIGPGSSDSLFDEIVLEISVRVMIEWISRLFETKSLCFASNGNS